MSSMYMKALAAAALVLAAAPASEAQSGGDAPGAAAAPAARTGRVPFGAGERLSYSVYFGRFKVGRGSMEITGVESVRGRDAFHAVFRLKGGTAFYKVNDVFESWMDTSTLASLRFLKDQREGRREKVERIEIFPERGTYTKNEGEEQPSVDAPLDDASFLYFIRTTPLEVGQTYDWNRYFKPDRNPVRVRVLRRERVKVPAGTFDALVLQPTIKTSGLLAESRKTEVWVSDDEHRVVLRVHSKLPFGSLTLALAEYDLAVGAPVLASAVEE